MAYYKVTKKQEGGGGATILKGTADPISAQGSNGQLFLKYGADTDYIYDEDLGGYFKKDYYVHDQNTYLSTQSFAFYKIENGGALTVYWHSDPWYGPIIISTVANNVKFTGNGAANNTATIDGITWYISTDEGWNSVYDSNHTFPVFETDYTPDGANIQKAVEDILAVSGYGSHPSMTMINETFAKVNNTWQSLVGTDVEDISNTTEPSITVVTGSFTSGSTGQSKVEVNCGFKPDIVMVDMEFGNGVTRSTYLSTASLETTDHPISVWDLRPVENHIYAIEPNSVSGETGITDLTSTGFKYRVNGSNTWDKPCTYTAIKF